ncbi:hypothetical protein H632_c1784p0 [Helicosporidium sp. ATCC 50920]|nr:hypothetical protein H632_c1784p0 [Helicosporidium sp. ATCC 50920]|eukprot:KDD73855.1 hypothetical protein H632_c1784p0 [Helicosporidium sp. ATCC 50920]
MAQTGEPWQGVESKLEALSLEDQEAVPQDSGAVPTSDMSSNTPLSEDVKFGAVHSELERAAQEVDHALSDALCHPKNRHMVLHLEAEVERFVQDDAASTHVFMHDMTSYEVCARAVYCTLLRCRLWPELSRQEDPGPVPERQYFRGQCSGSRVCSPIAWRSTGVWRRRSSTTVPIRAV